MVKYLKDAEDKKFFGYLEKEKRKFEKEREKHGIQRKSKDELILERNMLIIYFMRYAGLRVSEVVGRKLDYWSKNGKRLTKAEIKKVPEEELTEENGYKHTVREIPGIRHGDIDWDTEMLRVEGKGGKVRYVPLRKKIVVLLTDFAKPWEGHSPSEKLFKIGPERIPQILEEYSKKAGVRKIHPHMLRHTFAVNYIKNGGRGESLKKILGHTDYNTTQIYVDFAGSDLKADLNKTVINELEKERSKEEIAKDLVTKILNSLGL